jgi:hypothetical protein
MSLLCGPNLIEYIRLKDSNKILLVYKHDYRKPSLKFAVLIKN